MRHLKTTLTVLGALTVLLLAGNTVAYAASGQTLLLGRANQADKQTSLVRSTSGPALRLATKSAANAPLSVNGRGRVLNLNADKVDGLDASALRTRSRVYTTSFEDAGMATVTLPVAEGSYLIGYSVYALAEADTPINVSCWVIEDRAGGIYDRKVAMDATEFAYPHVDHAVSGSGLVTKTADAAIQLQCSAADGEFRTGHPAEIVVTPTSRLSSQGLNAMVSGATPS